MSLDRMQGVRRMLEALAHRLAARLHTPRLLRLRARLQRHHNALLGALLALGVLLMMMHWAGGRPRAPRHLPARPAHPAQAQLAAPGPAPGAHAPHAEGQAPPRASTH